jgi:hypothetical protein
MALNDQSDDESLKETPGKPKARGRKGGKYDEKNIRRRVYDALNVLMAMDIISKEKKQIKWKGLPNSTHHDLDMLHREKARRVKEIQRKRENLRELLVQQICYRNLVKRNREKEANEAQHGSSSASVPPSEALSSATHQAGSNANGDAPAGTGTTSSGSNEEKIPVPFIVVNTSSQTVIQCEMGPDRTDVFFNFSKPFEINDDNEILKRLGMHKTTAEELRRMLPRNLYMYCHEHRVLETLLVESEAATVAMGGAPSGVDGSAIEGHFGGLPPGAPGGYRIPGLPGTHGVKVPNTAALAGGHPYRYDPQIMMQQQQAHMTAARAPAETY